MSRFGCILNQMMVNQMFMFTMTSSFQHFPFAQHGLIVLSKVETKVRVVWYICILDESCQVYASIFLIDMSYTFLISLTISSLFGATEFRLSYAVLLFFFSITIKFLKIRFILLEISVSTWFSIW